jgi:hypothetical protein
MGEGVVLNSTPEMGDRILCVAAIACYFFALAACAVAIYALATLALTAYDNLGRGFYMTASLL